MTLCNSYKVTIKPCKGDTNDDVKKHIATGQRIIQDMFDHYYPNGVIVEYIETKEYDRS